MRTLVRAKELKLFSVLLLSKSNELKIRLFEKIILYNNYCIHLFINDMKKRSRISYQ